MPLIFSKPNNQKIHSLNGYDNEVKYSRPIEIYPPDIDELVRKAKSYNPDYRVEAVESTKLPEKYLRRLANDRFPDVCIAVAGNPTTPSDVLDRLLYVKIYLLKELKLPEELRPIRPLYHPYKSSEDERAALRIELLENIVENPNATECTREKALAEINKLRELREQLPFGD